MSKLKISKVVIKPNFRILDKVTTKSIGIVSNSSVRNSDSTFKQVIQGGNDFVLEDYDFELQDPDGAVISNTIEPAQTDQEFIVGASGLCPTTFDFNLKVDGNFQQVVTIDAFSDINITVRR